MDQSQLKYAITVDEDAWFIRFYLWLWRGDPDKITFCKLFWAYVFAVPLLMMQTTAEAVAFACGSAVFVVERGFVRPLRSTLAYANKTAKTIVRRRLDELGKKQARDRELTAARQREAKARREAAAPQLPTEDARQRYLDGIEHYGAAVALRIRAARTVVGSALWGGTRTVGQVASVPLTASSRRLWPVLVVLGRFLWGCGVLLTRGIDRGVLLTYRAIAGTIIRLWGLGALLLRLAARPIAAVIHARATSLLLIVVAGAVSLGIAGTGVYFLLQWVPAFIGGFFGYVGGALAWCGHAIATVALAVVNSQAAFWTLVGLMLAVMVGSVVMVAVLSGFMYWVFVRIEKFALATANGSGWAARRTVVPAGRVAGKGILAGAGGGAAVGEHIGKGFRGFLRTMQLGYFGVKTSTCPRIEVRKGVPDDGGGK